MEDLTNQALRKRDKSHFPSTIYRKNSHYWTGTGIKNTRKGPYLMMLVEESGKWLGVDREFFYASGHFAILPMVSIIQEKEVWGFAPRKRIFPKWHPLIM